MTTVDLTPSAARVLELLRAAGTPVKAYDLLPQLDVGQMAKPPTVYRALKRLTEAGLAHRILSLDAFLACTLHDEPHQPVFAICTACSATSESAAPSNLVHELEAVVPGFRRATMVLEMSGLCDSCR